MLSSTLIIFNNEDVQGEDDQTVLEDQVDEVLLPSVTNIQNTSGGWWAEEAIGSSWTYSTGFALDLNGVLHISYMEYLTIGYERFHLVYAKRVDNVWTKEYVESHHDFVGSTSSLAVDPSGKVYIAYYYNDYEDLKIAARNGTGWDISTIESSSDSGNYPSLVLDSNDRPIISYYKATGTTIYLRLARWNGTGWDLSTVDTNVGLESSIAIGSNDELHISYKKIGQPGGLGYAYWNNTTWNITIVDEYHYRVYYPSISLDSKERPHIAYYDFYDKDLLYAYKNGTGWNISKLEEENETGNYPSIVVDEDDHPHIVFSNQSTGQVIYIHWDGGKWIREVLSDKIGKYHGAILLDERDVPLIVQRVGSQGMTLFRKTYERINVTTPAVGASWSRGQTYFINWSTENLLNGSTVDLDLVWFDEHERSIASGLNASLGTFNWTLPTNVRTGSRHRVRIRYDTWSYVMGFSGEFNVPQEKGWYFDTVEKQLSGPISLVLDKNETPTIGFYSDGVKFSKWDVDHWSNVTVDNSTLLLYGLDMDLDSNDMPHYAYYDYTNRDLIYTRWNGTAWEKTTVDSSGDVGYFCSIAIDGSDNPHISYYDSTNANLKYAEWNGRQFNTETVDTFTVRRASDIKINSTDKPHIAYKDLRNGDMKLASRNGSGWDVQIVDAISYSLAPSLAIDEEDNFHIAYRGGGQYYAHWNGSGFSVEEIEGSINGVRPALDIDSEGYPHIIYQVDNDDHDYLQYTKWNGTGWESEMLIGLSNTYHSPWFNIELDSNDTPHIAFYREDGNGLEYGYKQSNATVPSSVSNLRVRESENGAFLEWDPPYEDGGLVILTYSLYRGNSTENLTFVGNISIDRTNYSDAIVEHNTDYYYAIIAVNSVGEANIVDAVKFKISIPVLFVDDDDGADHDSYFKAALNRTDHRYFEWDIYDSGPIGYANLSLYDVVIWATGDRASNTLTTTDQANLIDYLNGSGRLYLSSQDLFFDITSNTDGAVTNTFVNDFLEITSVDNDVNYGSVQGRSGDIITDPLGTVSLSVPYTNYGDEFTIGAEGSSMLTNPSSGNDVGVKVDNESFRVVFTSFGFEGIQRSNSTKGSEFMERTLEWLISEPGSPSPPTNITLNSASGFVHLIWDGPIETGLSNISRYNIYRTNTSADPVHYNWTTGSTLEFNDTSVIEGEVYRYMVTAANDVGESLPTDTLLYDQVSPVFVSNTSGGSATTGETMEINVTVTDNFEVGDVKMEYWFGSGAHVNESLGGSNPYTITLDIPNESHDDLNYFLTATDIAGNKAIDHMMYVLVTDNDRPVLENDNTPSFGTTGEGVTFAIDASDNVGIGSIFVEYWFGTGAHTNVTMTGESTFSYSISLPNNSTDPMHYLFSVKDTSFLWKTTSTEDVTITDNDLPYYGVDRTQNIGYTGDPHIFSIEVFDNVGVKYTMLNFWYNDGVRNISTQMGGAFPVNTTTATLPLYLSGTLYYYFTAYDESWNMYNSSVSAISVYDDILPVFGTDSTPTTRYTGEDLTFTISATDNVEIDEINVEYWVGTGAHSNVSMTGSDPYYLTLNGPWTSLDVIHYIFHASDPDGNWAHTSVKDITIIDNEKPVIGQDLTDTAATTGDSMLFSIAATDNINVDTVILHYQINGGPIVNITMTGTSTFIYQAVMPWNITGTLSYRIGVNDTSDNWNWTAQKFVTISDNDAPTFGTDVTPSAGFTGEEFTFEVAIIDNIMIQEASVEYWFGTGTHLILPLTDPSPYQITVTVHLRSTDTLHYLFNVNDTSDNQASTLQKDVSIVDDRRPELVSDLTPASTSTGDDLLIEVTLSDNIAMGEAYLEFWFGTQGSVNLTMTGTDLVSWNLSVEIALNSVEEL
ncbi:MAG: hypothetical protein KAH57_04325, partial [Thermoplasmata archaeon]|nr:hypothetical protein [Thermoplasmata archaeon]